MRDLIVGFSVTLALACANSSISAALTVTGTAAAVGHGIPEPTNANETLTWISSDGNRMLTGAGDYPNAEIYSRTRSTETGLWSDRTPLGIPHTTSTGMGGAYLSPDENWCYYGLGNDPDIYRSQLIAGVWSTGTPVPGLSAGIGKYYPCFNGTQLYYSSTSGGSGPHDIFAADADVAIPPGFENTGAVNSVNSSYQDSWPWISSDGLLLVFGSDRPGGYGLMDLYYSTRSDVNALWSNPINLGPNVNTASNEDVPRIAEQAGMLFFQRSDGVSGIQIMQATIPEPSTFILLAIGAIALLGFASRRRKRAT